MRLPLLIACLIAAPAVADPLPDPAVLTKGLPEPYTAKASTASADWAGKPKAANRLDFTEARRVKAKLGFSLAVYDYESAQAAADTLARFLATADPDTGHSYAFDLAFTDGASVVHLYAPCRYSNKRADELADRVLAWAAPGPGTQVRCRCGQGCREEKR